MREVSRCDLYSFYVFQRTDRLNQGFEGNADDLRRGHDRDLVGHARWREGNLDVFCVIDSGRVVFELLENEPVWSNWEFA